MTAVWRRSRDIAILRALGMAPSQSRWAALTQATVFSVAGLLVGIPLGLAAGRTLWRVTAGIIPLYYQAPVARGTLLLIGPAVLACGLLLALIDLSVPEREHVGVGSVKLPAGTSPRHDTARHDHIVARFDPQFRVELELLEVLRNLSEDTLEHLLGTGECPVRRNVLGLGFNPLDVEGQLGQDVRDVAAAEGLVHSGDRAPVVRCRASAGHGPSR
jgi:hypothetical protein